MDFKAKSANRGETQVDVVPSSPDGYFRIGDDPFLPPYGVSAITLRRVKPRHVRALQAGNTSVMDRYVVTDAARPGVVSFTKCDPGIPDPLQPVGTTIYVREAREVHLDRSAQIDDAHRAVGEWWAQRMLNPTIDAGDGEIARPKIPDAMRAELAQKAGDFALILADRSRQSGKTYISFDYHPDPTLRDVAEMAFVPADCFSFKSYTHIDENGVVTAREGYSGEVVQIWPPVSE